MLSVAGIYAVGTVGLAGYFHVEVTADGTCYQLTPALKRDGVLDRDGWHPGTIVVPVSF